MALAGVMRALDSDVAMANDRLKNLPLFRPKVFAQQVAHPTDRIRGVRVLGWVEQISECLPGGGREQSQPPQSVSIR
jgi:hypothetical protein